MPTKKTKRRPRRHRSEMTVEEFREVARVIGARVLEDIINLLTTSDLSTDHIVKEALARREAREAKSNL